MYSLNAKRSTTDKRDYIYDVLAKATILPNACNYIPGLQRVRNQGKQGTCYAQAASCMKEWQEKKNYGLNEYLSPQFFYNNRDYWNNDKKDGEDVNEDYGMTGRDVLKILQNVGICKESEYPYGTIEQAQDINSALYDSAKTHVIERYARVITKDKLKQSLIENGPCLIAFPVFNYTNQLWVKRDSDNQIGGHAMLVVGYDDEAKCFIIRNSWGSNWGNNGYSNYYYKDWGCHWECWTTIDANIAPEKDDVPDDIVEPEDLDDSDDVSDEIDDVPSKTCWDAIKNLLHI